MQTTRFMAKHTHAHTHTHTHTHRLNYLSLKRYVSAMYCNHHDCTSIIIHDTLWKVISDSIKKGSMLIFFVVERCRHGRENSAIKEDSSTKTDKAKSSKLAK